MSSTDEAESSCCPCCTASFSRCVRKPIACVRCDFVACLSCYKTWTMNKEARSLRVTCMSCKQVFDVMFMKRTFPHAWASEFFDKVVKPVLREAQAAHMEASQNCLELRRRTAEVEQQIKAEKKRHNAAMTELTARMDVLLGRGRYDDGGDGGGMPDEIVSANTGRKCPREGCPAFLQQLTVDGGEEGEEGEGEEEEAAPEDGGAAPRRRQRRKRHVCPLCSYARCACCMTVLPSGSAPHRCDETEVASVRAILANRDTKLCPVCGTAISKVSGCDQMYCTHCDTAFSWRTGNIDTGLRHNPHWHEMRARLNRQQQGAAAAAEPPRACAGLDDTPLYNVQFAIHRKARDDPAARELGAVCAGLGHIGTTEIASARTAARKNNPANQHEYNELRISLLSGAITNEAFEQRLLNRYRTYLYASSKLEVLQALEAAALDVLRAVARDRTPPEQAVREVTTLREIANEALRDISRHMRIVVPLVDEKWKVTSYRAESAAPKRKLHLLEPAGGETSAAGARRAEEAAAAAAAEDDDAEDEGGAKRPRTGEEI